MVDINTLAKNARGIILALYTKNITREKNNKLQRHHQLLNSPKLRSTLVLRKNCSWQA